MLESFGWPVAFQCQLQSLLVLDLIGTWLGLGLRVFGTKGLTISNHVSSHHTAFILSLII